MPHSIVFVGEGSKDTCFNGVENGEEAGGYCKVIVGPIVQLLDLIWKLFSCDIWQKSWLPAVIKMTAFCHFCDIILAVASFQLRIAWSLSNIQNVAAMLILHKK